LEQAVLGHAEVDRQVTTQAQDLAGRAPADRDHGDAGRAQIDERRQQFRPKLAVARERPVDVGGDHGDVREPLVRELGEWDRPILARVRFSWACHATRVTVRSLAARQQGACTTMPLELQPGDVSAGNIRILAVLGKGAFACVYKVDIPGYAEPLALKLTKEPVTAGDQAQRALREITILRSLTNPHVVKTFDCGLRPDGHIYMRMDFLQGSALDEWHDFEQPLAPDQAVSIVHQVCLGLAEAHAKGIVHRDVKPENIFVERSGHIRLLDFGLARSWDGSPVVGTNATQTHMVVGTPHYSQPEQLKTRELAPSSDVY